MLAEVDAVMTKILQLALKNAPLNNSVVTTEISKFTFPTAFPRHFHGTNGISVLDCEDLDNFWVGYYKLSFAVHYIVKVNLNGIGIQQTTVEDLVEVIAEIAHNMLHYRVVKNVECYDRESFEKWVRKASSEQGK